MRGTPCFSPYFKRYPAVTGPGREGLPYFPVILTGTGMSPRPEGRHVLAGLQREGGGALLEERLDAFLRIAARRHVADALEVERDGVEWVLRTQHAPHQATVDRGGHG